MSKLLLGIDDAGRGPVMGPMCLAGVIIKEEDETIFAESGIKDSKLLTAKKRDQLVETITKKAISKKAILVTPIEIDTGLGMKLNLNEVEALTSATIINELTSKLNETEKENIKIILDCPSVNLSAWKKQLMHYVKDKSLEDQILCDHKADFKYPVVSAASIIAKTTRDAEIEKIKQQIGINFGSGYPSDPNTIAFLKENATNPKYKGIFRESWQTWKTAANNYKKDQKKLF